MNHQQIESEIQLMTDAARDCPAGEEARNLYKHLSLFKGEIQGYLSEVEKAIFALGPKQADPPKPKTLSADDFDLDEEPSDELADEIEKTRKGQKGLF